MPRPPWPIKREHPLTRPQQTKFLTSDAGARIRAIRGVFDGPAAHQCDYLRLAGAAIFARSLAGFLGFSTGGGQLRESHEYFPHHNGKSWEVKLTDIDGGSCLKVADLTADEHGKLEAGLKEINLAFAHLTFWDDPANQTADGRATDLYRQTQLQRLRDFADTVIDLYNRHTAGLPR